MTTGELEFGPLPYALRLYAGTVQCFYSYVRVRIIIQIRQPANTREQRDYDDIRGPAFLDTKFLCPWRETPFGHEELQARSRPHQCYR